MFVKTGKNLFLPEGDDYSKTEFDYKSEEVEAKGNELLNQLRAQQQMEKTLREVQQTDSPHNKQNKPEKQLKKEDKKMSFGEIFQSVAGKRK